MKKPTLLLSLLFLGACSKAPDASHPIAHSSNAAVEIKLNSPDEAIKSWWRVRDLTLVSRMERCKEEEEIYKSSAAYKNIKKVTTGLASARADIARTSCQLETYGRDITEVRVESDTRAVILALIKPTTPLPPGAEPTKYDEKRRTEGKRYKYVLEKVGADWKMAQMYAFEDDPINGGDWNAVYEETPKPYVHSLIWGEQ